MSPNHATWRWRIIGWLTMACAVSAAAPAESQDLSTASPEVVGFASGVEVVSDYIFRGVRQNSTGLAVSPFGDLAVRAYSGDGPLMRVGFHVGFWNSLNTGDTGSDGPVGKLWYESRIHGGIGLRFRGGLSVATGYTAYTSPNDLFTTVEEIGIRVSVDDLTVAGVPIRPYALTAFEVDADPGMGQLDGGSRGGKYLEVGVAPSVSAPRARLSFPVKVGVSLADYYEVSGNDNTFGFLSVAGIATVPLGRKSRAGQFSVHGGVEIYALGETTKVFNRGDPTKVVTRLGIGLAR